MAKGRRRKLEEIVEIVSGQVDPTKSPYKDMPHVGGENIESNTGRLTNIRSASEVRMTSGKYLFDQQHVLYSKIRPYLNKVALPDFSGVCSADIYPIRPKNGELTREFLAYLLRSRTFLNYTEQHSTRTNIPKINREALLAFESDIPREGEQRKIVQIVRTVDRLEQTIEKLIDSANYLIVAVFFHLFGNPISNSKDWDLFKLADIANTTSGGTPNRQNKTFFGNSDDIPWVKSGELDQFPVMSTEEFITADGLKNSSAKLQQPGTVLVALYGATVGKVSILGIEAATNQAVCCIRPSNRLHHVYLAYLLRILAPKLVHQRVGGAQPNISQQIVRDLDIVVPPDHLQTRFVQIVDEIDKYVWDRRQSLEKASLLRDSILYQAFNV